ncbi:MAG: IS1380 family transposase, partial [Tannerellaceae bacterium]|nr:IS1380 family transposase [Tannerellaceae bacterium]
NFNTYGDQQYTLFNNYYDDYCYMPFFIFESISGKLISPLLRPGRRSKNLNIFGVLRRVIEILRKYWKRTIIVIRGDSHFCCTELMSYCERNKGLYYITGLIGLNPLKKSVSLWVKEAESRYRKYKEPIRMYRSLCYGAVAWKKKRRVIVSINVNEEGTHARFIITNFSPETSPRHLYERVYTQRGTIELYIKEIKSHLKGHKMSCSGFCANPFRLFLHGAAYLLMHAFKTNALAHTSFDNASMITLREKFLLVAVHIKVCKTKVKVELPHNYPHKEEFSRAMLIFGHLRLTG